MTNSEGNKVEAVKDLLLELKNVEKSIRGLEAEAMKLQQNRRSILDKITHTLNLKIDNTFDIEIYNRALSFLGEMSLK